MILLNHRKEVGNMTSVYNAKTRFLVLDIETTMEREIFDISFAVYSRKEGKIGSAGYKVLENIALKPFYKAEYEKYSYKTEPFAKIMAIIEAIIVKYELQYGVAYNSGFDFTEIAKSCKKAKISNPLEKLKELDLYNMAAQTLGRQKWFKEFVDTNKLLTEKGNRKSSAEIMYAYMILNPEYKEPHTGLGDIEIEIQILERVLRQKKKMSTDRNKEAWKIVQG
jgi:hypothetical protein